MPLLTWIQKLLGVPERFDQRRSAPIRRRRREELVHLFLTRLEDRRVLNADFALVGDVLTLDQFTEVATESLEIRDNADDTKVDFVLADGVWTNVGDASPDAAVNANVLTVNKSALASIFVNDNGNADAGIDFDVTFGGVDLASIDLTFQNGVGDVTQTGTVMVSTLDVDAASVLLNQGGNDFGTLAVTTTAGATLADVNGLALATSSVGTDFSVTVGGSISNAAGGAVISVGGNLSLSAGGDLGADGDELHVQVAGTARFAATASDIFITSDQDLEVDEITTGGGADEVRISATGNANLTLSGAGGYTSVETDLFFLSTADGDLTIQTTPLAVGALDVQTTAGDVVIAADTSATDGVTIQTGGRFTLNAGVTLSSADGAVTVASAGPILLDSGSLIQTADGGITLGGVPDPLLTAATGNSVQVQGIRLDSAALESTGGDIRLRGQGHTDAAASDLVGVLLENGSTITSLSGIIEIHGTAGAGLDRNFGVHLLGAGTLVTSGTGAISITGFGAGTQDFNDGIRLSGGAAVESTGAGLAGTIMFVGTASLAGRDRNNGILLTGADTRVAAFDAAIELTGTGHGSGIRSRGIQIDSGASVESTGAGSILLEGTGSTNGSSDGDHGVIIGGTGGVGAQQGDLTIVGIAVPDTKGLFLQNLATIGFATGTGDITLTTDEVTLRVGAFIQGLGDLVIQSFNAETTVGLGDGGGAETATHHLGQGELSVIQDGFNSITIGRADGTGRIIVGDASFLDPLTLRNPGAGSDGIEVTVSLVVDGSLTFDTGGPIDVDGPLQAAGDIALLSSGGAISINADIQTAAGQADHVRMATTGAGTLTLGVLVGYTNVDTDHFELSTEDGLLTIQSDPLGVATLELTNTGTGSVDVSADVSTTAGVSVHTQAADASISGQLSGDGGLTKSGSGTLILANHTNNYTGATFVNAGTLLVDGQIGALTPAGDVTVLNLATLGGSGDINADVFVQSGGTLSPGSSPGILAINDLNLDSGAIYLVEFNVADPGPPATFDFDQLFVRGEVNLNADAGAGATLTFDFGAGFNTAISEGDQFIIIDNDGTDDDVLGEFNGLPEGFAIANFGGSTFSARVTYMGGDGNDVVLVIEAGISVLSQGVTIIRQNLGNIEILTGATEADALLNLFQSVPIADAVTLGITISGRDDLGDLLIVDYGSSPDFTGGEFNVPIFFY
ncbi:MAG TPA: autotransporter-associated beta strand repeat-containing protein, partial [Planctomycetaceae bacterium]|nr:autotransporter-associated beta strand repeat-containing protein [Planctomycetaceae bacterium]